MMPTYLNPLNGLELSAALAESAAYASIQSVRLMALEVWHPSMAAPARLVVDEVDLVATLEADAPRNASEVVTFTAARVDVQVPEESDQGQTPEITLRIDNVTGLITDALRTARAATDPAVRDATWELIERVYMSDDTSAPAILPVFKVTLVSVSMQGPTAVFTAAYRDSVNTSVPAITFSPEAYPGLLS